MVFLLFDKFELSSEIVLFCLLEFVGKLEIDEPEIELFLTSCVSPHLKTDLYRILNQNYLTLQELLKKHICKI